MSQQRDKETQQYRDYMKMLMLESLKRYWDNVADDPGLKTKFVVLNMSTTGYEYTGSKDEEVAIEDVIEDVQWDWGIIERNPDEGIEILVKKFEDSGWKFLK